MEIRRRHDNPNQNIGKLSGHYEPFNPCKQAFNETKKQAEKKEVSSPVDSQKKIDEMRDKQYLSRYREQTKQFLKSEDGERFYKIHRQFTDLSDEIQNYGMKDFRKVMEYNREYKEEYDKNLAKLAEMFNQKEKVTNPIKLQKQYNDLSEQTLHTLDPVIKDMEIRFETKLREQQKEMNEKYGSFSKYPENVQRQINALQEKRSAYMETYLHDKNSNEQTDDQLRQQLELSNDAMTAALLQRKEPDRSSIQGFGDRLSDSRFNPFDDWSDSEKIGGKWVMDVPGRDNNCAFYALLRNPRVKSKLEEMAKASGLNVEAVEEKVVGQARKAAGGGREMLHFNSKKVGKAVEYLRKIGVLEPDCDIRVHLHHHLSGDIMSFNATLGNTDIDNLPKYTKPPYEVFFANAHYRTLVNAGDSPRGPKEAAIRLNETSKVDDSPTKRKLTELLLEKPEIAREDDGRSITDLKEIKQRIDEKVKNYQEVGIPVDKIYQDVISKYPDVVAKENVSDEQLKKFLEEFDYELSKERFFNLGRKMAPLGYEQAVEDYFKTLKPGAEQLNKTVDLLEANKNDACEWLFENRNVFDPYKTDAFYKTMQGGHIASLERHFEGRSEELSSTLDNPVITDDEYGNISTKIARAGEFENKLTTIKKEILKEFKANQEDEMDQTPEYYKHLGDMEKSLQEAIKFMESELPSNQAEKIDISQGDTYGSGDFGNNSDKDLPPDPSRETQKRDFPARPVADVLQAGRSTLQRIDFVGINRRKILLGQFDKLQREIKTIESRLFKRGVSQESIYEEIGESVYSYMNKIRNMDMMFNQGIDDGGHHIADPFTAMENIKADLTKLESKFELEERFVAFGKSMAVDNAHAEIYAKKSKEIYRFLKEAGANEIVINGIMEEAKKDVATVRQFFDTSEATEINVGMVSNWLRSQLEKRSASPIEPSAASKDASEWNKNHRIIEVN